MFLDFFMAENIRKNKKKMIILEPIIQKYTFAQEFKGNDARKVFNAVTKRISKDYKDMPDFGGYFEFNEKTQKIKGSSLYHGILINNELRKSDLHLPSVIEGKALDISGKLTDGIDRDYGVIVYNSRAPNLKFAKELVEEAIERDLELPLLIPFNALNLKKDREKNIISIFLREEVSDIITGKQTREHLKELFRNKEITGVRRLFRDWQGYWDANLGNLSHSSFGYGIDWVCGEVTIPNLKNYILEELRQ